MTLGLAIPYHSHPELLKKTLDSVLRQTSSDWECTVYDDSRDEKCKILVEGFGHPKIKYILNPNSTGMVSNWNYSLQNTKQLQNKKLHPMKT
jgi:glycosyltransferase involved in cell wall biosynthesis